MSYHNFYSPGLQCFEGMKAYRSLLDDDSIHLFRPDKNMERLSNSMHRLHMPGDDFDREELIKCIGELVKLDKEWIPSGEGYSLYIRPTVIATHRLLGVAAPNSILLFVITCPVGPYYKTGFNPIKVRHQVTSRSTFTCLDYRATYETCNAFSVNHGYSLL
jgi:branched-chain amino acid aminotransferase